MGAIQKARLTPAGAPSGLYYVWDEAGQKADLAAGIPVNAAAQLEGVDLIELPAGKAVAVDYYGPYSGSGEAHYALDDYLNARCWKFKGPAIEEYITDPGTEPDTMKWLTRVIYFYE
jgi:effector-binding domain-containing protein